MTNSGQLSANAVFMQIRSQLDTIYDASEARQLALILLNHFAAIDQVALLTSPTQVIKKTTILHIQHAVNRLLYHEPIQYITGVAHFYGYYFLVSPQVLIPRPETEELVRWIIEDNTTIPDLHILDIGTGSGCIAIVLGLEIRGSMIDAIDIMPQALTLAKMNNDRLGGKVNFMKADVTNPAEWPSQEYDIIVSNPPYIPAKNKDCLPRNVAMFEPSEALFVPDDDPLLFYRSIVKLSGKHLKKGGNIYIEVQEDFAEDVENLFITSGFQNTCLRCDLNGRKRMVRACRLKPAER